MQLRKLCLVAVAAFVLAACEAPGSRDGGDAGKSAVPDPFPSTYKPYPSQTLLIANATVIDGARALIENGAVLIEGGKIKAVGADVTAPDGATTLDARGKWITPGIIDNHSHLGAYPSPGVDSHGDGNEISGPVTSEVWVEHSVWPQDPGFSRALAGGITSLQILPGSANLFGGRGVTLKNVPARTVQAMKFPGAPYTLKMACGENPKRVYGYGRGITPGGAPYSRMGNVAGYRDAWIRAADYKAQLDKAKSGGGDAPTRDLELETLAGVLSGDILVHMHCYRADEMAIILDISNEFGYKVAAFHHAVESYKIADKLAEYDVCSSMWADWWGFKMEAYDAIWENIAFVDHPAKGCAIVHSDSEEGIQRLNQEAAKAMARGNQAGLSIAPERAIRWITSNAARSLGVADEVGSLTVGKRADVVIWNRDPFSVYARADQVYLDGARVFDRAAAAAPPASDFMLGQPATEVSP